jgi:FtsP/CotA-like multicopper oxidase with cupredoxin domain
VLEVEFTRRRLLKAGLIGGGAIVLPVAEFARVAVSSESDPTIVSPPVARFAVPLAIPPTIAPTRSEGTTDFYDVTEFATVATILPGRRTPVWTYNGTTPGPTFDTVKGRVSRVTITNHLGVPTTTHLHGGDTPPQFDGHPLDLVQPGTSFTHVYPGDNSAATLWYHDHAIHATGRNVYMGLAGMFIVRDDVELGLGLPKGPPFEVPLVVQDRLFNPDGSLFYPEKEPGLPVRQGAFGDVILVNGTPFPFLRVQRRKYRFRLLNGSNARFYQFELSTGDPITVIGSDGGFLEHPVETPSLFMAEAERYDVVIDFAKYPVGTKIVLRNTIAPDPFGDPVDPDKIRAVMRFDVVADATSDFDIPADLGPGPIANAADAIRTRDWEFERRDGAWVINDELFAADRIDAFPQFGTTEIWRFINKSGGWLHPIHPHLVEFRILDRNGRPPKPYETGPKDVVALGPNETIRVAMKFVDFRGTYVFHCHNIEHEDHDMMTQFRVV